MAKVAIISVGKLKTDYYKKACEDYAGRIQRYADFLSVEIAEVRLSKKPSDSELDTAKAKEGARLLLEAAKYDAFYCLDTKGKKASSEGFADMLAADFNSGINRIAFLIGGSNGLSEAVKNAAKGVISFSDMTFAHHLFRVMLAEQIYRAFTILNNEKYHK